MSACSEMIFVWRDCFSRKPKVIVSARVLSMIYGKSYRAIVDWFSFLKKTRTVGWLDFCNPRDFYIANIFLSLCSLTTINKSVLINKYSSLDCTPSDGHPTKLSSQRFVERQGCHSNHKREILHQNLSQKCVSCITAHPNHRPYQRPFSPSQSTNPSINSKLQRQKLIF